MRKIFFVIILVWGISHLFAGESENFGLKGAMAGNNLYKTVNDTLPDLIAINISFEQDTLQEGDSCRIIFKLQNIGQTDANYFDLEAYISLDGDKDISDDFFVEKFEATKARAGYQYNAWFDCAAFPDLADDGYNVAIVIILDSEEEVEESDESNTFVTDIHFPVKDQLLPELQALNIHFDRDTLIENESCQVRFTLQNTGYADADSFDLETYVTLDGDTDISDDFFVEKFEVTKAKVRYEYDAWFDLSSFPDLGEDIYYVGIVVILDSEEEVREENENNIYVTDVIYPAMDAPATGIYSKDLNVPTYFGLSQNYPNPFNPTTHIEFQLPVDSYVKIEIFDMLGRDIDVLINNKMNAGNHFITWDASQVPSGIYLYRMTADNFSRTRKLLLQK